MLGMPKLNGAAGMVLRGIGAMITGPGKIDAIQADIQHIKAEVDELQGQVTAIRVSVGEIKGYIKGHTESHNH